MAIVKLNKKYQRLYTTDKRYIILTGGRGSGKSFVVRDFSIRLLEEVGQGILYTRYTMVSVEKTIIPLFREHIELISDLGDYIITRDKITHRRTGSFILFSGIKSNSSDQTGRLKSLPNITTWIIEEGEDFNNEASFVDIDDSIRAKHLQNRVIWIQNPTTSEHFIYQKFFEGQYTEEKIEEAGQYVEDGKIKDFTYQRSTHKNVEHIHTTYYDNIDNLDEAKVEQWEEARVKRAKYWLHKYGGAWRDKAEGVIFEDWEEGEFNDWLPHGYGQDYGFVTDPITLIKVAVSKKYKKIYVKELFYDNRIAGKQMGTESIFNMNRSRIDNPNDLIVADSAEDRLIYDLQNEGLNIEPCIKGPGSVIAGIKKMQDYTIVVSPCSHNVKKELKNYVWIDKKGGIPIDDYNHAIDGIRYIFIKLAYGGNPYTKM